MKHDCMKLFSSPEKIHQGRWRAGAWVAPLDLPLVGPRKHRYSTWNFVTHRNLPGNIYSNIANLTGKFQTPVSALATKTAGAVFSHNFEHRFDGQSSWSCNKKHSKRPV